uniref:Uncharacterized protein n=1 Tax=Vitis vinifera TaxID=29760 RepID=F6H8Y4_VITVI
MRAKIKIGIPSMNSSNFLTPAGIEEIVEIMSGFSRDGEEASNSNKLQARKAVMSRMLVKSLHPCLRQYPILFIWLQEE